MIDPTTDPLSSPEANELARPETDPAYKPLTCTELAKSFNLDVFQIQAIEMALEGKTDLYIARALGINPKTLWRWKTYNLEYRYALAEFRAQLCASIVDDHHTTLRKATATLAELLDEPEASHRLRAAQTIYTAAGRFKHLAPKTALNDGYAPEPEPDLPPKVG